MNSTLFKWCRQFYILYPQIGATVSNQFNLPDFGKSATVSHEFITKLEILVNIFYDIVQVIPYKDHERID